MQLHIKYLNSPSTATENLVIQFFPGLSVVRISLLISAVAN
jgi:hypothetical protein